MTIRNEDKLHALEVLFIDWYDGMVTGAVRSPDERWDYLQMHWWSEDQDRRVFVATRIPIGAMSEFLDAANHYFHQVGMRRAAVVVDDQFSELVAELKRVIATVDSSEQRILLTDPQLRQGR